MKIVNIGLIGCGNVGNSVLRALLSKKKILENKIGISIRLAKVAEKAKKRLKGARIPKSILTKNADAVLRDPNVDIVVELIGGVHPAKEIILKAISQKKHVVTANKALLAEHGKDIFKAASRFGVSVGFEASVGGAVPVINVIKNSLVSNRIDTIYGILNGTSNFILSRMSEENCSFDRALSEAKAKGLAERNPRLDISGEDSRHKIAILALLGFGMGVKPADIYAEGIDKIDQMDIYCARAWGYEIKPLAIAKRVSSRLDIRVHPTLISIRSLLANVKDENNAIYIQGDMAGDVLLHGKGAGGAPAASAVISDIVEISKNISSSSGRKGMSKFKFDKSLKGIYRINDVNTRFYLRFSAIDRPGVLSEISKALADNKISIAIVTQKERKKGQPVPIIMLTHEAREGNLNKALARIDRMSFIAKKTVKIRIER
ncbi:MAG: homoserine dehydrogenase [Candidatus Omnitrophica bacterium]|nr:homoserine dehydrogenase [Candidatus Omnitrophota bacterium]